MVAGDDTIGRRFTELERQIRDLATSQRASATTITDADGKPVVRMTRSGLEILNPATGQVIVSLGSDGMSMRDAAGALRARVGLIAGSSYGMQVLDQGGTLERLRIDEAGFRHPYLAHPWVDVADFRAVTAADWTTTHRCRVELITHQGLFAWVTVTSSAGTTGEVRLRNAGTGATTSAVSVPAGSAGTTEQFRWLHGSALSAGPVDFEVQARRTAGTGDINVYRSRSLTMASPSLCTTTGLP